MARQACRGEVRGSQPRGSNASRTGTTDSRVIRKQRRCGSMKRMMFLGALVLGVTICSQSFGFELLDRMLGCRGCTSCCEPGCDAGAGCCEPGCGAGGGCGVGLGCGAGSGCAEPACGAGAGCCDSGVGCTSAGCCGIGRKHRLFGGLKGLFAGCKRSSCGCCDVGAGCCEPGCGAGGGCAEPACGAGAGCAEPACGAGAGCCEPSCGAGAGVGCCGVRQKCTPIRDLLRAIHSAKRCRASCTGCCGGEPDCSAGNGCCEPGCGAGGGCAEPACGADPCCSASISAPSNVVAVSRTVATK
jgi:hypothetical protein